MGRFVVVGLMVAAVATPAGAIELQRDTLAAWESYIRIADGRMRQRTAAGKPFLWIDEWPERGARARSGEILVEPVVGHGSQSVTGGLIHHWIGAVFIPGATLGGLFTVVHDYDRYQEIYKPVVAASKSIACSPTDQRFSMVWQRRILFVNAAVEGDYEAHDILLDAHRGYNIANTTRMREIADYGQAGEHLLAPDEGNGFIWRLHSIAKYEERDGGVYFELEAIALTRDVPASMRWLVKPVVNRLSVGSLMTTLGQTRDAVAALGGRPSLTGLRLTTPVAPAMVVRGAQQ